MLDEKKAGVETVNGGKSTIDFPRDDAASEGSRGHLPIEEASHLNSILTSSLARLSGAADLREFLAHVMGEVLRVTGAANVAVTRYYPSSNELHLELFHNGQRARWGLCGAELSIWAAPYDADITPAFQWGLQHRGTFVASMHADQCGIPIEQFALPGGLEWAMSIGVSDVAVSLLMAGENPVGTFHLHFTSGRILRREDLPLLDALVQQAAIALRIVGMGEQAKESAVALERERAVQAEQVQTKRINDFLSQTMVNLSNQTELSTVIESIIVTFAKYLEAAHVFLFRYDQELDTIRLDFSYVDGKSRWGMSGEEMALWSKPFPADVTPAWQIMCEQRGLFKPSMIPVAPEEFGWPGAFDYIAKYKLSDVGHIILFSGETPVGSIGFGLRNGRQLQPGDKGFVEAVAQQAAVAVRLVDLADQAQRAAIAVEQENAAQKRVAELALANEALRRSSKLLAVDPDMDRFVHSVLVEAMNQANAGHGILMIYRDGCLFTAQLVMEEGDDLAPATITHGVDANATPAWNHMLEKRGPILWDVERDADMFLPGTLEFHRGRGTRCVVTVPMFVSDKPLGYLSLALREDVVSQHAMELIQALADQAALALQLSQAANADKEAAIARERERASQERAVLLTQSNDALRRSVESVSQSGRFESLLESLLLESMRVTGAAGGGITLWNDGQFAGTATVGQDERILAREEWCQIRFLREAEEVLSHNPGGFISRLLAAPFTRETVEWAVRNWPAAADYHGSRGHTEVWNVPCLWKGELVASLGLAFRQAHEPNPILIGTLTALAQQMSLVLEMTRLSEQASSGAVALEREAAALHQAMELSKSNDALQRTVDLLALVDELDQLIPSALQIVQETFGSEDCAFWENDKGCIRLRYWLMNGRVLRPHELPRLNGELQRTLEKLIGGFTVPVEHLAIDPSVMSRPVTLSHFEGTAVPEFNRFALAHGWELELNVPLLAESRPVGNLTIYRKHTAPFTKTEITLGEALGKQLALALQASRLADSARKRAVELAVTREREQAAEEKVAELARANKVITEGLRQLAGESDLSRVPGAILMEISEQAKAAVCCWLDFDPEANTLRLSLRGRDKILLVGPAANEPAIFGSAFSTSVTPGFEYLLTQDDLVEFSAPENHGMAWPGVLEWHRENGRDTMLAYAVRVGDQPIGVVGMGLNGPVQLSRSQRELIRALANHLALAVHLSRLSGKASQTATLNERNRIAREIHDSLAQCFTGILMQLHAANRMAGRSAEVVEACVGRAEDLARSGLKQARRSVMSLIQEDELYQDLGAALRSLVENATADTGTSADVVVTGMSRPLHPLIAVNILRICQEALGNAQRYAHAKRITIRLRFEDTSLGLSICDDGVGFVLADVAGGGFGLRGMQERAERIGAALSISTSPGAGTKIEFNVSDADTRGGDL